MFTIVLNYLVMLRSCFLLCLVSLQLYSQKTADSTKKVVYSAVVMVDSTNRFDLYKKAVKWVESQKFEIEEEDPYGGKILAKGRFEVYTDKGVLAKPNGDFSHHVKIEIKDGRYRYTFDQFFYRKYQQNRDLKYVPVKGTKPIEDTKAPGWKKQWGKNKLQVSNRINGYIADLREAMKYVPPVAPVQNAKKEEW